MAPEARFADSHETCFSQVGQMPGDSRLRGKQDVDDVSDAELAPLEDVKNPQSRPVGKRPEHEVDDVGCFCLCSVGHRGSRWMRIARLTDRRRLYHTTHILLMGRLMSSVSLFHRPRDQAASRASLTSFSDVIVPLLSFNCRLARLAARGSCVTITIVRPSSLNSSRNPMIC
jgi:hypothetical protein